MKIYDRYRPEKCVLKTTDGSEVLKHMLVERTEGGRGILSATDGAMLVRLPVELGESDEAGAVSVDAMNQAREYAKVGEYEIHLRTRAVIDVPDLKAEHARMNLLIVPNTAKIFPKTKVKMAIGLDTKKLRAIAEAMGSDQVIIELRDEATVIVVRPINDGPEIGALMPLKTRETEKKKQKVMP